MKPVVLLASARRGGDYLGVLPVEEIPHGLDGRWWQTRESEIDGSDLGVDPSRFGAGDYNSPYGRESSVLCQTGQAGSRKPYVLPEV